MTSSSLAKKDLLFLYRKLLLIRLAEEKIQAEYHSDAIKTPVHLGIGTEAINVGVHQVFGQNHTAFGTYRNHAIFLAMTENTDSFFCELYGKASGSAKGKAGSMHLSSPESGLIATSAIVASTIPLAVGASFANQYIKSNKFVTVFFGDGAIEEGSFWESLNFACLHKLKILFICEDNELAIHTPAQERRGFKTIAGILQNFKCHVAQAEGANLLEIISQTTELKSNMEKDSAPGFLYTPYFRILEHVGINEDFASGYRQRPNNIELKNLDPVKRWEEELKRSGITSDEMATVMADVRQQINQSVELAQKAPFASPDELYADVWA